ncbi:MAG: hypothetical protein JNM74_15520, partial [Myxococcales bacterium]|nr:hypothetical protein [Myxococcales bacterium]
MRNVVFGMAATLSLLIAGGAQAQMVTKMKGGQPSTPAPAAPAPASGNPFGGRAVHSAPIVPFSGVADPMNMQKLQDIRSRQPKACGPTEISPGVWVRID